VRPILSISMPYAGNFLAAYWDVTMSYPSIVLLIYLYEFILQSWLGLWMTDCCSLAQQK
jgi:hypothetical protein